MDQITPEMARQELARRELARRKSVREQETNNTDELKSASEYFYKPGKLASELGQGAAQGLLNLPTDLVSSINNLTGSKIQKPYENFEFAPKTEFAKASEIAAPFAVGSVGAMLSKIPAIANIFSKSPAIAKGAGVIGGSLLGGATSPEHPALGFGLGAAAPFAPEAFELAKSGVNALRPSNLAAKAASKNLSDVDLLRNLEAAGETTTGLGDVIGSPFIKRQYENFLSKIPMSGANEKLASAGHSVAEKGKNILQNLLGGNSPNQVTDTIHKSLLDQFNKHQKLKTDLYSEANKLANKSSLNLELPDFSKSAKEFMGAIKNTNILKHEPDVVKIFNKLKNYQKPVKESEGFLDQYGLVKPKINYPTLKEANLLKGKLNHYANVVKTSPDPEQRGMASVFNKLSSSLKNDIKSAIEKSGNIELKNAYEAAEKNYKNNFSQFLDKDIYKFIGGNADPDTIVQSFLKSSRATDREKVLSKLANKLPEKERKLLGYSYFSRALDNEGNLNLNKLNTLYKNIGKNQLNALIPDKTMRNKLSEYSKLYKMNTKGVNLMENPSTGQQNLDIIPVVSGLLGGAIQGGFGGALAGSVAPIVLAKPIVNALTSPKFREKTVNAILKNRGKLANKKGK